MIVRVFEELKEDFLRGKVTVGTAVTQPLLGIKIPADDGKWSNFRLISIRNLSSTAKITFSKYGSGLVVGGGETILANEGFRATIKDFYQWYFVSDSVGVELAYAVYNGRG